MLAALRALVWLVGCWPLCWLIIQAGRNELGPDPGEAVVLSTGLWALRLLLITLVLRPLRDITGRPEFVRVRRSTGLFALFYASLHLLLALFYLIGWSWLEIMAALQERTYIILGFGAWLLLVPLGVTSTRRARQRMGRHWRQLHRLIYPAATLACLHFIWLVRSDYLESALYIAILAILFGWRLLYWVGRRSNSRQTA
ncbi:MAG: protein-methionine-sulfoxide reductase heme-binding subunit MsrQ [Spongiibacteraceae bacterium]|jgi:sulfoxide reductase heme-binding subunit YedZ|nr:protein-methionine-sulfoxide reductase heme-binding subunit MsrQ [Spongiibacteraceae bacterium]